MSVTYSQLCRELRGLGLVTGDTVMVHAALRSVGPILGGGDVLIRALLDVAGATGTVVAYADWEHGVQLLTREPTPRTAWEEALRELPPFDARTSRARRENGVLPELMRTWPVACRSANPDASLVALGARAEWLCADHPLSYGYGEGSPFDKLVHMDSKVLLLGAPLDTVTLLHHAEHHARLPEKRVVVYYEPMLIEGERRWMRIEEFDTSIPVIAAAHESYFADIVHAFVVQQGISAGLVGKASACLLGARDLVRFGIEWMERRWGADVPR